MNKIPTVVWLFGSIIIGGGLLVALALATRSKTLSDVNFPIEITEYYDYRCPHCADFYPTLKEIAAEYGTQVQINYRYFPVISPLEDGIAVAQAAEAARLQGKFDAFHNMYFDTFNNLRKNIGTAEDLNLETIATKIGLDVTKFNADRISEATLAVVTQHQAEAAKMGVNSTPTVFLEGQTVEIGTVNRETGEVDYTSFRQAVKKYIDAAVANQTK